MAQAFEDLTLDQLRAVIARVLPTHAAFDGWTDAAVDAAAAQLGVSPDAARFAFGGDKLAMIDAWFASVDEDMLERLPAEALEPMKIRQRITALVEARLDILLPNREALRRAASILAFPPNAGRAAQLGWRAADTMWRAAGDTATDYNHYSKRAILGGVYTATLSVFLNDESEDLAETRAFLARRIDGIMRFEKAKAKWTAPSEKRFSLTRLVSRLRYPAH